MRPTRLGTVVLAISLAVGGLALSGQARAHDGHGGMSRMAPGYYWGDQDIRPPEAGMDRGYGPCMSMMYGRSYPGYGWHHGRHMTPGAPGPGMMGHGMMGQGMMGHGMMGHGMMGQGMMGQGMMGQGMMEPGSRAMPGGGFRMGAPLASDMTAEQAGHMLGHRLEWLGLPGLKVGDVTEQDDDVIIAEIVTKDGTLVQRLEVDRHTGWSRPIE